MTFVQNAHAAGEIATGLLYVDTTHGDLHDRLSTVERPLNALGTADLVPGAAALASINAELR
jgi:2-oxoglutarate ferredoxin oxidoreductase subunit beta